MDALGWQVVNLLGKDEVNIIPGVGKKSLL
jgi:hypothetical protein